MKLSKVMSRVKEKIQNKRSKEEQAFLGDTYLKDLKKSYYVGKPWVKALVVALILGFLADLYFLQDTVNVAFDQDTGSFLGVYVWIVAATLVLLYLFLGHIIGKKLRDYKVFHSSSSRGAAIVAAIVLLLALASLTLFRLSAAIEDEGVLYVTTRFFAILSSPDYVDAVSGVFVMTLVMFLTAFISAVHAYYSGDAVAEEVYRISAVELPADRALYRRVFSEHMDNTEKEAAYEAQEQALDEQAIDSAFKLGSIASQLNGMVDPADAQDFMTAQRMAVDGYFSERMR